MSVIGELIVEVGTKINTGGFDQVIQKMSSIAVAGAAVTAAYKLVTASINAASESEQVVNKLSLAMKNQGIYTQKALETNLEFAKSLQQVTATSDEEITSAMQVLTTYGLHDEQLRKTTQTTLDFAKAKGIDLTTAANLVGKAFAGETGTMSRYGIVLGDNIPKSQKFAAVMDQLNTKFGGSAQNDAKTYAGQIQTFKNNLDEVYETIGKHILPALTSFISGINDLFNMYDKLNGNIAQTNGKFIEQSKYQKQLIALEHEYGEAVKAGDKAKEKQIDNAIKYLTKKQKSEDRYNMDKKKDDKTLSNSEKLLAADAIAASNAATDKKIMDWQKSNTAKMEMDVKTKAYEDESRLETFTKTEELTNQLSTTFTSYFDYMNQSTENKKNKDINAENLAYENKKAWIIANVSDETQREKQLNDLATGHEARINSIKEAADQEERRRKQKMKPVMIAEAVANTALGFTKALAQSGILGIVTGALVLAAGAWQIAQIASQKFAQGGMVTGATLATIGEAGNEVALPLTHPNTINALSGALQKAMNYEGGGGTGGHIFVTVPPISTRQEAKRMGQIVGDAIFDRVKRNRRV